MQGTFTNVARFDRALATTAQIELDHGEADEPASIRQTFFGTGYSRQKITNHTVASTRQPASRRASSSHSLRELPPRKR
jgi:hypothetical protein